MLQVVDKALKEVAIEDLLKNLEEVWLSMQFQLKPYSRLHTEKVWQGRGKGQGEGMHVP